MIQDDDGNNRYLCLHHRDYTQAVMVRLGLMTLADSGWTSV